MNLDDYLKMPEKYIPSGMYCYDSNGTCPFWDRKPREYPSQEDGYCHYLGKSDWELNEESQGYVVMIHCPTNRELEGKSIKELFNDDDIIDKVSGKKVHFGTSLLWDQCKECGINTEDDEDVEYTTIEADIPEDLLNAIKQGSKK